MYHEYASHPANMLPQQFFHQQPPPMLAYHQDMHYMNAGQK